MVAIYANASITIIAASGSDAEHGLRGMRDVSRPIRRNIHQDFIPFPPYGSLVRRIFPPRNERPVYDPINPYYQRGWTLQEQVFSKRRIVFENESVIWECSCATWFEDVDCSDGCRLPRSVSLMHYYTALTSTTPQLYFFTRLVQEYNQRQLTYEEDCLAALSGTLSGLNKGFRSGFICGLPEVFFDVALLWRPVGRMKRRRKNRHNSNNPHMPALGIPSWSWSGWSGPIDLWSWQSGYDFVKRGDVGAGTSCETIPTTTWHVGVSPSCGQRQEVSRAWYNQKELYRNPNQTLEEGWTRHASPGSPSGNTRWTAPDSPPPEGFGSCFYTHVTSPSWQFWYPIPLPIPNENPAIKGPVNFLYGTVELADFYTDGIRLNHHAPSVSLVDSSGQWAGILRPHNQEDLSHASPARKHLVKLIAISLGRAKNSEPSDYYFEEWHLDMRPRNGFWYEFYNVLWISQDGDIACREGIGRVRKDIWDCEKLGMVDLVLG